MEEKNQPDANIQAPTPQANAAHGKILQPSEAFVTEMKAAQVGVPGQQPPSQQLTTQSPSPMSEPGVPSRPIAPAGSIYPDPANYTQPVMPASIPAQQVQQREPKHRTKAVAIRIVAGLIVLLNVLNAYNWYHDFSNGYANWVNISEIVVIIILAIGIFALNEAARVAYVFLSAIVLVLSCIGLFTYFTSMRSAPSTSNVKPLTKAQLEYSLQVAESNTSLPANARQEDILQLQRQIADLSANPFEQKAKQYISDGLLIITAAGPLLFLTRPSIKETFH